MSDVSPSKLAKMATRVMALPEVTAAVAVVRHELTVPPPSRPLRTWPRVSAEAPAPATVPADNPPAEAYGGDLVMDATDPRTLQEALRAAVAETPEKGIVYLRGDGTEDFQSYPELLAEAQRLLAGLRATGVVPGEAVLFQFGNNRNFISAFWACVLGGYLPTPVGTPPRYDEENAVTRKLRSSWELLGRPLLLTDADLLARVGGLAALWQTNALRVEAVEALRDRQEDSDWYAVAPDDPVLHLLTSGSTGTPKCVRHSHRSIIARTKATALANGFTSSETSLNWMPLDHVGGLVMWHIRDVILRCQQVHAEIGAFLANPVVWLDWIERFQATNTWAPNFAFALVNDAVGLADDRTWDLASMRHICNGGEAIVAKTAHRFLRLLRPHRLPAEAMRPSWGMSETSSGITFSTLSADDDRLGTVRVHKRSLGGRLCLDPDEPGDTVTFTEVGSPAPGVRLRIVHADDSVLSELQVGRLQVRGPMVMSGYYRNDDANRESFTGDGWFNTGDLAFLNQGRLTIAGREKDVIIVRGANYLAFDVESVVEAVDSVETTFVAACGYTPPSAQTEELVIFFVPRSESATGQRAAIRAIRDALSRELGLHADQVIPVRRDQFPKTNSGKIQRAQLIADLASGVFDAQMARLDANAGQHGLLYERVWVAEEALAAPPPEGGTWLLLGDDERIEQVISAEAARSGVKLVSAHSGSCFTQESRSAFTVRPDSREHHQLLLDALRRQGVTVTAVLHAWQVGPTEPAALSSVHKGPLSVLATLQALRTDPAPLLVLTTNGIWARPGDRLLPLRSTLPGLVRTAAAEQALALIRQVDLSANATDEWAAAIRTELSCPGCASVVAYRQRERLVSRLRALGPSAEPDAVLPFVPGGIYLVTGGLGGVGQVVSEYLLAEFGAKLLLVGRKSADSEENARRLAELAALGDVRYHTADVADPVSVREAIDQAERCWGQPLTAVWHLAATDVGGQWQHLEEHTLDVEDAEAVLEVYGPKVFGTLALAEVLSERPDTPLVLFSSVNAEFGGRSFGAYSSASSFLNGFADHWSRERARPVCSISWSGWAGIGMNRSSPLAAGQSRGFLAITEADGVRMLADALASGRPNLIAGLDPGNVRVLKEMIPEQLRAVEVVIAYAAPRQLGAEILRAALGESAGSCPLPVRFVRFDELPTEGTGRVDSARVLAMTSPAQDSGHRQYVEPSTDLERTLAAIWSDVLKRPRVGREDSFFEIGGNSMLAVQLVSRMSSTLGVKMPVHQLYENPEIGLLAGVLADPAARARA